MSWSAATCSAGQRPPARPTGGSSRCPERAALVVDVTAVVRVDRRFQRHAPDDFDTGLLPRLFSLLVVGEQHDLRAVQDPQHACGNPVVPLVIVEPECRVGVESVEAVILELIGPGILLASPSPRPSCARDGATAEFFEPRQREPKLVTAVATP